MDTSDRYVKCAVGRPTPINRTNAGLAAYDTPHLLTRHRLYTHYRRQLARQRRARPRLACAMANVEGYLLEIEAALAARGAPPSGHIPDAHAAVPSGTGVAEGA